MDVEKRALKWYGFRDRSSDSVFVKMIEEFAGAGAGEKFKYDLKSRVKEMVGVDLDPRLERYR